MDFRVGLGYDVHRLASGRKLVLGGVEIPYEYGLLGHSDADVLTHAAIDAILGAMALGDIGRLFPDNDNAYKNISSMVLLREVSHIMQQEGYALGNLDTVIVAQKPKLLPYMNEIRQSLAAEFRVGIERISVKATTEEGLGFTGDGSGMAAKAIVLLYKN